MSKRLAPLAVAFVMIATASLSFHAAAQEAEGETESPLEVEGSMTLEHMHEIILALDENAERTGTGAWSLTVEGTAAIIITDAASDRMRILVGIRAATDMTDEELMRVMQANFDSALDARYAIARDVLWAAYVHPLAALHDRQFIVAIGQTVNLALSYGTTYTSGLLLFGGGDSGDIIRRDLIEDLLRRGEEI